MTLLMIWTLNSFVSAQANVLFGVANTRKHLKNLRKVFHKDKLSKQSSIVSQDYRIMLA